jgi:hypothetical protein
MKPEEAREIAAPDSWPWPMSQEAQRWIYGHSPDGFKFCGHCHQGMDCGIKRRCNYQAAANATAEFFNKSNALGHSPEAEPVEEHAKRFDSAEHERFMKGLG